MVDVTYDKLVGLFEALDDIDEANASLQLKIKTQKKEQSEKIKEFAKDHECKPADVKKAFKYWQEAREQEDPAAASEDFFSMCVLIDCGVTAENGENS
jgi:hypothetical protein